MKILFVTQNHNKLAEIKKMLPKSINLYGLSDISFQGDIDEPYSTLEENALHKANFIYKRYNINCFADDTGLEVDALSGMPGALSARYAGKQKSDADNIQKLLKALNGKTNRQARFKTVIALILNGKEYIFEGAVKGNIISAPLGNNGFGYDPIFVPQGSSKTFAEMSLQEKNKISHRYLAIEKLSRFLTNQQ